MGLRRISLRVVAPPTPRTGPEQSWDEVGWEGHRGVGACVARAGGRQGDYVPPGPSN